MGKKNQLLVAQKQEKLKILRSEMYPKVFDLFNFCSDDLKKSLDHGREFD